MQDAQEAWEEQAREIAAGRRKNLFDELEARGFVKQTVGRTNEQIREAFRVKRLTAYVGIDPTAKSLHLGHLVVLMPIFWMYLHGYGGFSLIGSSTARIGDPTGRTKERPPLRSDQVVQNLAAIHHQLKGLWESLEEQAKMLGYKKEWAWSRAVINNNAWWNKTPLLEVMKRLGAHMRLGPLLSRDNVKSRLTNGTGMSFAELTYPLMQGWDWYELYRQRGCLVQIGGSDQYGNILTGIECLKACVESEPDPALKLPTGQYDQPFGFTVPLLTDKAGQKLGKSTDNDLWLDPFQTTPYDLYGYLVRRPDDEVERLLKLFTFHPLEKIADTMVKHNENPALRIAQHMLAFEILRFVHGKIVAEQARSEHQAMYGNRSQTSSQSSPETVPQQPEQYRLAPNGVDASVPKNAHLSANNHPRIDMRLPRHLLGNSLPRIVYAVGMSASIGDADRMIKADGIYVGGAPGAIHGRYQYGMIPEQLQFVPLRTGDHLDIKRYLINDKVLMLRKGKHNLRVIEFISDEEWKQSNLEYPGQPGTGALRKAITNLKKLAGDAAARKDAEGGRRVSHNIEETLANVGEKSQQSFRKKLKGAEEAGLVKKDSSGW